MEIVRTFSMSPDIAHSAYRFGIDVHMCSSDSS